mgnify:CR=1 FL=1|tara:strand:+ start:175 stop:465 length:291 start_codon:yes stop_codon:yes gene_type:complete
MKKIAADRNYRMFKRAQEEAPVVIFVTGLQFMGTNQISIRAVSQTGEILWTKGFRGKEDKINEAKEYIATLKQKYPNTKIDTKELQAPLTPEMLGL